MLALIVRLPAQSGPQLVHDFINLAVVEVMNGALDLKLLGHQRRYNLQVAARIVLADLGNRSFAASLEIFG